MRLFSALILLVLVTPSVALADDISIRPFLIDTTLVPRESTTETIVLTSPYDVRTAIVYATVNEITVGTDGEIKEFVSPVMTDRTNTITSWISVDRGRIEIPAGEAVEIPVTIKTHPHAEPGEYHAFIGFVETSKRNIAESRALAGDAEGVLVTVRVGDERQDSMRITSMVIDRFITDATTQQAKITVANAGEIESAPRGELIFYDNRGFEVSAVAVNDEGQTIAPGEERTFVTNIPLASSLGKYKANITLNYGESQRASLYDSSEFYMLPLYYIYVGIGLLTLLLIVLVLLMRRGSSTHLMAEEGEEVPVFIKDGHVPNPQDHDIDLSSK